MLKTLGGDCVEGFVTRPCSVEMKRCVEGWKNPQQKREPRPRANGTKNAEDDDDINTEAEKAQQRHTAMTP